MGLNIYDDYYAPINWFKAEEIAHAVRLAEQNGVHSVWLNEDIERDSFVMLGNLAAQTSQIGLATGVANVYTRSAVQIAMASATLNELSNGRAILGVGYSGAVSAGQGIKMNYSLQRAREYITVLRKMLSGKRFSYHGVYYHIKNCRLCSNQVVPADGS